MEKGKFFCFNLKDSRRTVQMSLLDNFPSVERDGKKVWPNECLCSGDFAGIEFPVTYVYVRGRVYQDILAVGSVCPYLFSDSLLDILVQNGLTGWASYPAKIFGKKKVDVPGYSGFSVTGKAGECNFSNSTPFLYTTYLGKTKVVYRGFWFGEDEWDGSDFFFLKGKKL